MSALKRGPTRAAGQVEMAVQSIKERMKELRRVHASYRHYLRYRISESDHHGGWDCCVNLSETECEIAGLEFALKAIGKAA